VGPRTLAGGRRALPEQLVGRGAAPKVTAFRRRRSISIPSSLTVATAATVQVEHAPRSPAGGLDPRHGRFETKCRGIEGPFRVGLKAPRLVGSSTGQRQRPVALEQGPATHGRLPSRYGA